MLNLKDYIRNIPDFPKPGIIFRDITTALKSLKPSDKLLMKSILTLKMKTSIILPP